MCPVRQQIAHAVDIVGDDRIVQFVVGIGAARQPFFEIRHSGGARLRILRGGAF
jgi:hypothetical protein